MDWFEAILEIIYAAFYSVVGEREKGEGFNKMLREFAMYLILFALIFIIGYFIYFKFLKNL